MCNKGITQFYLPPTHKPYLPLLPSHKSVQLLLSPSIYVSEIEQSEWERGLKDTWVSLPRLEYKVTILLKLSPLTKYEHLLYVPVLPQLSLCFTYKINVTQLYLKRVGGWQLRVNLTTEVSIKGDVHFCGCIAVSRVMFISLNIDSR